MTTIETQMEALVWFNYNFVGHSDFANKLFIQCAVGHMAAQFIVGGDMQLSDELEPYINEAFTDLCDSLGISHDFDSIEDFWEACSNVGE